MGLRVLLAATVCWPTTARIAGGLAQLGCHVDAFCPSGAPVHESRFVNLRHAYNALSPLTSLRDALSISRPDLIIPCDDRAVQHVLRLRETEPQSAQAKLVGDSLGAPENYPAMISRASFMKEARALGISVPETISLMKESQIEPALAKIGLPAVLKVDGSWGGDGVAIVHTRAEAIAAWRKLSRPLSPLRSLARTLRRGDVHHFLAAIKPVQPIISIQQFIAGEPATTALSAWNGNVSGTIHMDVVVSQGVTGPASVLRRVECAEMEGAARAVARRFALSGLHGLDFIRDANGRAHLLEINPRATQTSYLALGHGHDLLAGLVASASGQRHAPRMPTTTNNLIALFPQEWARDSASPYLKSAYHDIPWEDPGLLRACIATARPRGRRYPTAAALLPPVVRPYGQQSTVH
ncbi:MAG TPA: hypothetical protein VGT78_06070 [Rhizomicrobium sp.]|nr:hypothetical protein [Rhizomicrobium sp.]